MVIDKNWPLIDFDLYRILFELNKLLNNEAFLQSSLAVCPFVRPSVGRQPLIFGPVLH